MKIERIVPMFPVSKDDVNYQRLMKVLSLYRLTLGQTRQEELVDYFLERKLDNQDFIQRMFIDLCPYNKPDKTWKLKFDIKAPEKIKSRKSARQAKIDRLKEEIERLEQERNEIEERDKNLKKYNYVGMKVRHKIYGEGVISKLESKYITVNFKNHEATLRLPNAFFEGYLESEYEDLIQEMKNWIDVIKSRKKNEADIEQAKQELKALIL